MRDRLALRVALAVVLLVAVGQTPGVTAPPPHFTLLAGSALGVLAGVMLWVRPLAPPALGEVALALSLGLLGWLSSLATLDPFLSRVSLAAYFSSAGILAATALSVGDSRRNQRATSHVLLAVLNALALYAIVRGPTTGRWLQATFTNADCFSVFPMVGALLALGLLPRCRGAEQIYLGLAGVMQIGVTLWTGSRAGGLGLLVGLVCGVTLLVSRRRSSSTLLVGALLPVSLVCLLVLGLGGSETMQKWKLLAQGRDSAGLTERLDVLAAVPALVAEHPTVGSGPGTFHLVYQSHHPARRGDYMNVAHNDYVQVLVELGPVGLLLWLALLGTALAAAAASARKPSAEHAGAGAALVGIATYSLFNFALPVVADLYLLYAVLGLAVAGRGEPARPGATRAVAAALVLAGVAGAGLAQPIMRNNQALAIAQASEDNLEWERGLTALEPVADTADTRVQLIRARLSERLFQLNHDKARLATARQALERVRSQSPQNIDVMLEQAQVRELEGDLGAAEQLLRLAVPETPHTEAVRVRLARNLVLQNQPEAAADVLSTLEYRANPEALGELLLLCEQRQAGRGLTMLSGYLEPGPRKTLWEAARVAGQLAHARKQDDLARQFLALAGDDRRARFQLAQLEKEPAAQIRMLEALLEAPDEDEVRTAALQLWTAQMLSRGDTARAVTRLESELSRHSDSSALRLLLAGAYQKENRLSEASRVLEEGFDFDADGSLHKARAALPSSGAETYP